MLTFCESITATSSSPWHVRETLEQKFGGGINTNSLCGRVRASRGGWDLDVPFDSKHPAICLVCKKLLETEEEVK